MKQIRKMSNLVAEELQSALEANGVTLDESAFEERVSNLVNAIDEAFIMESSEKEPVTEDDKFYMATKAGKVGGIDVAEGEYVEFEDTDDGKVATIYDEDGNIKESDIPVDDDEAEAFSSEAEELEDGDEDDVDEDVDQDEEDSEDVDEDGEEDDEEVEEAKVHIKGGKKVKMTKSEIRKKKAIAQGKKREGMKWDGKRFVKMTAQEKKRAKLWAKKMHKGSAAAHAKKSHKKAAKIAAGSTSGTVTEAFDIKAGTLTFTAEAGDTIVMEDNLISVIREGNTLIQGIQVSEGFMARCIAESVVAESTDEPGDEKKADECGDAKECGDSGSDKADESDEEKEEKTDEAAMLTFKANSGYVLVREGKELVMGNRVRARATLVSEGFNITSTQLDAASKGELVTL